VSTCVDGIHIGAVHTLFANIALSLYHITGLVEIPLTVADVRLVCEDHSATQRTRSPFDGFVCFLALVFVNLCQILCRVLGIQLNAFRHYTESMVKQSSCTREIPTITA